jgi:hypothetical protein
MSRNYGSKYVKKVKFDVISNLMIHNSNINLVVLQFDLSILVELLIESMTDCDVLPNSLIDSNASM